MPLYLLLAVFPGGANDLRIDADRTGQKVTVSARLPAAATLPEGQVKAADGERWLRFCLVDGKREGPPILGTYQRRQRELTFVPRFALQPGKKYRAYLGLEDKETKSLEYRVPERAATAPAAVARIYPSADVLPANHLRFFIHFSAPMRGGKDIFDQIRILDAQGNAVDDPWLRDELWDESGKLLILYIHPGRIKWDVLLRLIYGPVLEPDQEYTLVLSADMLDANGQRLGKEYRKKFRTTAEHRARVAVDDWRIKPPHAGGNGPVIVSFPKIMDHSSLDRYLSVRDDKGQALAGKIDIGRDEKTWFFTPAQPWTAGTYTLVIDERLEDTAGNTPLRPFDLDPKTPKLPPQRLQREFRATSNPRGFRFSEIMVIVYADFPKEPEHQLALAKYTASKGFNCVEAELDKLEVCRQAGLKVRLGSNDVGKLLRAAPKLKDDPAVLGYFISDRRTRSAFPGFARTARAFEAADPNHPTLFINRAEYNQFPEFVEVVKPMVLDYYHYHWWHKNHPERYYLYLSMFRDLSVKHGIPQMRCLGSNNPPEKIRQSMYVALAYGVQALHFWPPWFVTCKLNKDRGAVLEDGKPVFGLSDAGKAVSEIARELKALGPVLVKLQNLAVYHTDKTLPLGARRAPDDLWFQPEGESFLVGIFHDADNNRYLMPVNHGVDRTRELKLRFREKLTLEMCDRTTAAWRTLALTETNGQHACRLKLAPGDGALLRVKGDPSAR
ncbi:MAG: hypothetical protein FJ271_11405 [Planctomycetes bacterium]|nr:hypothetical protein [Planctomycetota bacterium]